MPEEITRGIDAKIAKAILKLPEKKKRKREVETFLKQGIVTGISKGFPAGAARFVFRGMIRGFLWS